MKNFKNKKNKFHKKINSQNIPLIQSLNDFNKKEKNNQIENNNQIEDNNLIKNFLTKTLEYENLQKKKQVDTSSHRSHSLILNNYKLKKNHVICGNINQFNTIENSDLSNSSTYNSSVRTHLFSEQNLRKFLMKNEINLIKRKINQNIKHSILLEPSNISNSEMKKNNFIPVINLTNENNETYSYFSNSINQKKRLKKMKSIQYYNNNNHSNPIKILSYDFNNNSSTLYSEISKIQNLKSINENLTENSIKERPNSSRIHELINFNNFKENKFKSINNDNKLLLYNVNSSSNIKLTKIAKRKIDNEYKENNQNNNFHSNKKTNSLNEIRKILSLNELNELSPLKIINDSNTTTIKTKKTKQRIKSGFIQSEKRNNKNKNKKTFYKTVSFNPNEKNHKFINYSSNKSENESNFGENREEKIKNSFHYTSIFSYLSVELNKKNNPTNIHAIINKNNNKYEKEISNELDDIEKKKNLLKKNILASFNNKIIDIAKKYENYVIKLGKKFKKKNKSSLQLIQELIKDKKMFRHAKGYLKLYLKRMLRIKNRYLPVNKYYINSYLNDSYFQINIYEELFYKKYLNEKNRYNYENFLDNFKIELLGQTNLLRRRNILINYSVTSLKMDEHQLFITYNKLPLKNIIFIGEFYFTDYEYNIRFKPKKILTYDSKLRMNDYFIRNNIKMKKKYTHFVKLTKNLKCKEYKDEEKEKEKEKEKKDLLLLNNALSKTNFYIRKGKESKKLHLASKRLSRIVTNTLNKNKENNTDNHIYYNKNQMLSQVNDLKYQIIQNLQNTEALFFFIKDNNYPAFKELFEKNKFEPDLKDLKGNYLLSLAVQSNSFSIVNYLLNAGSFVNTQNNSDNTPLHYALSVHNFEIADMLIQRGADEKLRNNMGRTPWQCLDKGLSII